jgi:hypothetical protein
MREMRQQKNFFVFNSHRDDLARELTTKVCCCSHFPHLPHFPRLLPRTLCPGKRLSEDRLVYTKSDRYRRIELATTESPRATSVRLRQQIRVAGELPRSALLPIENRQHASGAF